MLTLLANARVLAPQPLGVRHLLLAGGRIVALTDMLPELSGVEVETVDLDGARVMPGLVDGHVHVTGGGGEAGFETSVPPVPLTQLTTAGVTSVVGLLGTDDTVRSTEALLARTRALRAEGLSAWCLTGGYHVPPRTLTGSVRGDIVHLDPVIGVGEVAISDHRSSQPSLGDLLRVAADAHVAGLMTGKAGILHLHVGDGERGLDLVRCALDDSELPPSAFHPTHVNRRRALFDEACKLVERGVTIDVTAFPPSDDDSDEWSAAEAVGRYLDAGLPHERLTVSSDAGGSLPTFDEQGRVDGLDTGRSATLFDAIGALLDDGREPADVLAPFTTNPARAFRLTDKGRLAVGAAADLVVLGDDHRPRSVMARGRWHVRDGEVVVRGTFER